MKGELDEKTLNAMTGPQLDLLHFLVFGNLAWHLTLDGYRKKLKGKVIPPDKLEVVEQLLTIAKNI